MVGNARHVRQRRPSLPSGGVLDYSENILRAEKNNEQLVPDYMALQNEVTVRVRATLVRVLLGDVRARLMALEGRSVPVSAFYLAIQLIDR